MDELSLEELGFAPPQKPKPAPKPASTPLLEPSIADGLGDTTEADPLNFSTPDTARESLRGIARNENVPDDLVLGQARAESDFNANAVGDGGKALGILQTQPIARKEVENRFNVKLDPSSPEDNARAGVLYMKLQKENFERLGYQDEDLRDLSAAAFNAGPTRVAGDIEKAKAKFKTDRPTFQQVKEFLPQSTLQNVERSRLGRKEDQVRALKAGKVSPPQKREQKLTQADEGPAFQFPTVENTLRNLKTVGGVVETIVEDFLIRFPIEGTGGTINGIIEAIRQGDINAFPKGFEASQGTLPLPQSEAGNKVRAVFGEAFEKAFGAIDAETEKRFDIEKDPEAAAAFNVGLKSLLFLAPAKNLGKRPKPEPGEPRATAEPEFQFSEQGQKIDNVINLADISDNPFEARTALNLAEKELNVRRDSLSPEEIQRLSDRIQGIRDGNPPIETPVDKSARGETLSLAEINEATAPKPEPKPITASEPKKSIKKRDPLDVIFSERQKIDAQTKESAFEPEPAGKKIEKKAPETAKTEIKPVLKEEVRPEPESKPPVAETLPDQNPQKGLSEDILSRIGTDKAIKNNIDLKNLVAEKAGKKRSEVTNEELKQAQEETEFAHVQKAREIVESGRKQGLGSEQVFNDLVDLNANQPTLTARSSTSLSNQAFSTPAPISFVASELARIGPETTVLEPTAGHGSLLIGAKNKVTANEIEPFRLESLKRQGFKTSSTRAEDPKKPLAPPKSQEAVIVNPPFGGLASPVKIEGFKISRLDHLIAAESLKTMKDDGRAVLIVGGELHPGGKKPEAVRVFENFLYSRFNVADQFQIAGKLYRKQGAGFPIKIYNIAGRKRSESFSPKEAPDEVSTFGELYDRFTESLKKSEDIRSDDRGQPAVSGVGDSVAVGGEKPAAISGVSGTTEGTPPAPDRGRGPAGAEGNPERSGTERRPAGEQQGAVGRPSDGGDLVSGDVRPGGDIPNVTDTAPPSGAIEEAIARGDEHLRSILEPKRVKSEATVDRESVEASQVDYKGIKVKGKSAGFSPEAMIPANQAEPVAKNLSRLVEKYGPLDEFVMQQLGYKTKDELHKALFGIQVDSLAGAIDNAKAGHGFIVGDQTGVGKGRQAAAMIRWAKRQGWVPVFISSKGDLFTPMARDIRNVGEDNKPFVFNSSPQSTIRDDKTGEIIQKPLKPSELAKGLEEMAGGRLPEGYDSVFLTYSQYQNLAASQTKIQALKGIAHNAYFILDESHNAGGAGQPGGRAKKGEEGSNIFRVTNELLRAGRGVTYLSATWSKRPDTMPLYGQTSLGTAFNSMGELISASNTGGTPFQNLVSAALVEKGQLVRREKDFKNTSMEFKSIDESKEGGAKEIERQERVSDVATEGMREINDFSEHFSENELPIISDRLQAEGKMPRNTPDFKTTLNATNFSSKAHNFVKQLLLGLKVDQTVESAVTHLKAGRKPFIVVENTMETFVQQFMKDSKVAVGGSLGKFTWGEVLKGGLKSLLKVSFKNAMGESEHIIIKPSELSGAGQRLYNEALERIKSLKFENPVSPIDAIKQGIEKAGFTIGEMSGRKVWIDYSGQTPTVKARDKVERDKPRSLFKFQNGDLDALIVNASAKEGIDAHSDKAVKDQRQRVMLIAQANADINVFTQILGRVDRNNQVNFPLYEVISAPIPAEIRPASILRGKMAKLNANTQSNSKSSFDTGGVDLFNEVGDEVVMRYLEEDPTLADELNITMSADTVAEGFAAKATGRLALLPVSRQKAVWGDLTAQFNDTIEYMRSIGENPLDTDFIDLQAEKLEGTGKNLYQGSDQADPFDRNTELDKWTIKKQTNPMTASVVKAEVFEKGREKNSKILEQRGRAILKELDAIAEKTGRPQLDRNAVEETIDNWKRYAIGTGFNLRIQEFEVEGVVVDIQITNFNAQNGNVFAPSRTKIIFAVNQGVGRFGVTLSRLRPAGGGPSPEEGMIHKPDIDEMFGPDRAGNPREERFIITGNLIRGFSEVRNKGQIIDFSTKDGKRMQGILMPKGFDPATDLRNEPPLRSPESVLEHLKNADPIRNKVGLRGGETGLSDLLEIRPTEDGGILISIEDVPLGRRKYITNPDIVKVTGDFFGVKGGRMGVTVPKGKALEAIRAIMLEDKTLFGMGQPQVTKVGNKDSFGGVTFSSGVDPSQIVKLFENTTGKLFDAASNSRLQYFSPLRDLPEQREYLETRALGFGETARIGEIGRKLFDTFSNGIGKNRELSQEVYDYLTTKEALPDAISDPEMREKAVEAKELIRAVGRKLVAKGIMHQKTFDKYDGEYLPIVYLRHLLGLDKKSFTSTGAGLKVGDLGYLKERNPNIPEDVKRFVLGEIKDPAFLLARGFTQPMKDMAVLEVLEIISQNPNWVLPQSLVPWQGKKVSAIWLKREAEFIRKQAPFMSLEEEATRALEIATEMEQVALPALDFRNVEGHKQVPDSNRYGRLRGMWVRDEIFDDLIGTSKMISMDDSLWEQWVGTGGKLSKATALWKVSKVALNPPTQVRNLVSNMVLMHLSGVPMMRIPDLMIRAVAQIIQGEVKGNLEKSKVWQEAKLRGINATTFNHQEMLQIQEDYLSLKVREEDGFAGVFAWMKHAAMKGFLQNASNIYGLSEAIGKTAKMIHEIETKGANPADAYAEAQKWLFDYSLVPPSVRTARTAAIGAPFLTFQYKVLPRLAEVASKAPHRLLPYLAIPYILAQIIASTYDVDSEDVEVLKKSLPFWLRKPNVAVMPYKDQHDRWQVTNFGYFLPWGQFQDLFEDALDLDFSESLKTTGILGGPVPNVIAAVTTNIDPFTKMEIVTPGATPSQQAGEIMNYTWRLGAPTWLTDIGAANHMRKSLQGTVNPKTGEPLLTHMQAALRFMGVNVYPIDPKLSRGQNIRRMKFEISQSKRAMNKQIRDANLTPEQKRNITREYQDHIKQMQTRLQDFIAESRINPKLLGPPPKR